MEPHGFFVIYFIHLVLFFVLHSAFPRLSCRQMVSALSRGSILCVAMLQNASYLPSLSVVSRFRSTTQNN